MSITAKLTDYESAKSLGHYFRKRRSHYLLSQLHHCHNAFGRVNVIDIGGRPSYWNIFPESLFEELNISVLLVNYENEIAPSQLGKRFSQLQADGCDLHMFDDQEFHLAHSNSVIEHVGNWERVQQFSNEIKRVGQAYYVQTPNFGFPVEPHFVCPFMHWLPEQSRAQILQLTGLGPFPREKDIIKAMDTVQSIQLLNTKMMTALFPEARLEKERFLGLVKSVIAVGDVNARLKEAA